MKIIYVENVRIPSERAHAYQIVQTCAWFSRLGHEVILVNPDRAQEKDVFQVYGIKPGLFQHVRLPVSDPLVWNWFPFKKLAYVWQRFSFARVLEKWASRQQADAWYTRDPAMIDILNAENRNWFLELHDRPDTNEARWERIKGKVKKFITITDSLKEVLIGLGIEADRILVASDGYDPHDFQIQADRQAERERLNVPPDAFVAIYIGSFYPWKGVDLAVRAWQRTDPDSHLVLIGGPASDRARLEKLVDPEVLRRVHILPAMSHSSAIQALVAGDIGLLASSETEEIGRAFTSPLKQFEYLAAGLPILASDVPSSREILNSQVAKFYTYSEEGFIDGFFKIKAGVDWRKQASVEAKELVAPHTWEARSRSILEFMASGLIPEPEKERSEILVSFIFPAFNEAENLKRFPTEVFPVFDALGETYEIIVIDDGSSDNTAEVAIGLGGPVRLVKHEANRGLGAAVRTGISSARGDLVVTMDTDLTFAPTLVPALLERFKKGDVDAVSGSPKMASLNKDIPFYRIAVSYIATFVYAIVIGRWMRDISPIFRLYKREHLLQLPLATNRFEINAEILFHLVRQQRKIAEMPAPLTVRIHGESKLDYRKEIIRHLKLVWRMILMRLRSADKFWWLGIPAVTLIITWFPYWIWNIFAGAPLADAWWRVQIAPQGVFDSYIYFHWLGAMVNGYDYGGYFRWFGGILSALNALMPKGASVIEFWLVTRWLSTVASIWIGSWSIQKWSGLDVKTSRFLSIIFWLGFLLTLSFRPGVTTWYWPFCTLGMTLIWLAQAKLSANHWRSALILSLAGIFISSVYAWFLVFVFIWSAVIWGLWLANKKPLFFPALASMGVIGFYLLVPSLANWFNSNERIGFLDSNLRNGIAFSRIPFLSNTVLVIIFWIALFSYLTFKSAKRDQMFPWLVSWLAMLFVWFHSVFTNLFTHNDHFISPVIFLGWVSLAFIWHKRRDLNWSGKAIWFVALFSTVFFFYILQKPLLGNAYKFNTYVIHLVNWFSLAVAVWIMVLRGRIKDGFLNYGLFAPMLIVGVFGWTSILFAEMKDIEPYKNSLPVIQWIKEHVSPPQTICAEPDSAGFYGAHTGRPVLPGEGPIAYPVSTETIFKQLETIVGSLDTRASGTESSFVFFSYYYRDRLCRQFSRQAGWLKKIGYSEASVNRIIGCPREAINASISRVRLAVDKHRLDERALSEYCPFIIVGPERLRYWNLPASYQEVKFEDGTSIWKK